MKQVALLRKQYTELAPLDFDILLAHAIHKPKEFLHSHPEYKLSLGEYITFRWQYHKRRQGVPIAYLTHHKEFFGLDFFVNRNVLTPRPETELLVEEAINQLNKNERAMSTNGLSSHSEIPEHSRAKKVNRHCADGCCSVLIDIGTGSGCIPIAIAKHVSNKITIIATDISRGALRVASKNAKQHNVDITFLHGNLLDPVARTFDFRLSTFDSIVITANLPYGWLAWKNEGSAETKGLKFEPKMALFTGENGLELIKKLLLQIKQLTAKVKNPITVFLEFDPRQTELLNKIIKEILPGATTEIKKDLAGRDRVAKIVIPTSI